MAKIQYSLPSLSSYFDARYNQAYNKKFIPAQKQRINHLAFNYIVYQNSFVAEERINRTASRGVASCVSYAGNQLLDMTIDGACQLIQNQTGIDTYSLRQGARYTIERPLQQAIEEPCRQVARGIGLVSGSVIDASLLYNAFGEYLTQESPRLDEDMQSIASCIEDSLRKDESNLEYSLSLSPRKVGIFQAIKNAVCRIAFPVFGCIAKIMGNFEAANDTTRLSERVIYKDAIATFSQERDGVQVSIDDLYQRLDVRDLTSQRYHSVYTDTIRSTYGTYNSITRLASRSLEQGRQAISNAFSAAASWLSPNADEAV